MADQSVPSCPLNDSEHLHLRCTEQGCLWEVCESVTGPTAKDRLAVHVRNDHGGPVKGEA